MQEELCGVADMENAVALCKWVKFITAVNEWEHIIFAFSMF